MEEKRFPRYFSRYDPCAGGGECIAFTISPCFPIKVLLSCGCRLQGKDLAPGPRSTPFSINHTKQGPVLGVSCGWLRWAGVMTPQHSHPSGLGDTGRNQKACVLVDRTRKERECLGRSTCRAGAAAAAVFLGVASGWRSRKEQTRLPDEFIASQIALIETHLCFQGCTR